MVKLNLSCLSGIRCLCCLWIVLLHVHGFSAVFPISFPCMKMIRETPFFGFLASTAFAVDIFWILSGFLCEYQLHYKVDTSKPFWYIWFMVNRLIRLYPLYLIGVFTNFTAELNTACSGVVRPLKALFFLEIFSEPQDGQVAPCAGAGWSVHPDVHGYLVIILLFLFVQNLELKKCLLWSLYLLSCLVCFYHTTTQNLSWPFFLFGLDLMDPKVMEKLYTDNPEMKDKWPNPFELMPEFNPFTDERIQLRERHELFMTTHYFTSITNHGASLFLGSILAINLIQRTQRKNGFSITFVDILKWCTGAISLYMLVDLQRDASDRSALWTVFWEKWSPLVLLWCVEVVLVLSQRKGLVRELMELLFANKIWKVFGRYTYGVYLFHIIPLFVIIGSRSPSDVENGGVGPDGYGWPYLLEVMGKALGITMVVAVIAHYLFEFPVEWLRYKYVQGRYAKEKEKKKN